MKQIASLRNPALQRYRELHDAAGRRATGLASAEGLNLLREALLSETDIVQVFVGDRARRRPEIEELLARLEAGEAVGRLECFALRDDVLERVANTESPQGVLLVFRPRRAALAEALAGRGPALVLERVSDPGNLGLIVRTAEAAGASGVMVTPGGADPLSPKCVRASAGSIFRLPVVQAPFAAAAAAVAGDRRRLFATSPRGDREYSAADLAGRVAFILGQEGGGLPADVLDQFESLRIPTGRVESLNVAMTAGVLLYEARRQRASRV